MAELVPQALDPLLRRMAYELAQGACFDLPARSFHRVPQGLDLSVDFHGERAANGLGPAAGPHTQLAQNLVLSYLAGGRILELKTVQVKDDLVLPRPCIDAANVGFNVEWSQELRLTDSLAEYVKAHVLLHALRHADLGLGLSGSAGEFLLDMSVGYDLAGIRSQKVARFLAGMLDARGQLDAIFDAWPKDLLAWRPPREKVPNRVSDCITLSTFHGCPAEEIEKICEHLLCEVGTHLVVKMNPTLLGYEEVHGLLCGQLGYEEIRPHKEAFDADLKWDEALGLMRRLSSVAAKRGLHFGAKFSNTLVVENHKQFFPAAEKVMYLSGQPLHVITFELCRRFREAFGATLPISFSAGVDAKNFADCVAAGFAPVTTCTDLLRPGGYGRLPRYLDNLAGRMRERGVSNIDDFILAQSGRAERCVDLSREQRQALVQRASLENHARLARGVLEEPRYAAKSNRAVPRRIGTRLWLFDCITCDKCVQVCPNDANFSVAVPEELRGPLKLPDLVVREGRLVEEGDRLFALEERLQLANYADFCNECGNCDVFCPEDGGPYLIKPRFYASTERMRQAPSTREGFALEHGDGRFVLSGRHEGQALRLELLPGETHVRYDDGAARVELSLPDFAARKVLELRKHAPEGHRVRLDRARAMTGLLLGLVAPGASSPVSAPYLSAVAPPKS